MSDSSKTTSPQQWSVNTTLKYSPQKWSNFINDEFSRSGVGYGGVEGRWRRCRRVVAKTTRGQWPSGPKDNENVLKVKSEVNFNFKQSWRSEVNFVYLFAILVACGRCGLQTASEVRSDLRIELSYNDYVPMSVRLPNDYIDLIFPEGDQV